MAHKLSPLRFGYDALGFCDGGRTRCSDPWVATNVVPTIRRSMTTIRHGRASLFMVEPMPPHTGRGPAPDDHHVGAHAQQRRLALGGTGRHQQMLPRRRIGPARGHVGQRPAGSLDTYGLQDLETRLVHLSGHLLGPVKVGRGEPFVA